jgi:hypothetical protein
VIDEANFEQALTRLAELERRDRSNRQAIAAMLAVIVAGMTLTVMVSRSAVRKAAIPPPAPSVVKGVVEAESFVLKDHTGKERAWLFVDSKDDTAKLRLIDGHGKIRVTLRASNDRGSVGLFDSKGSVRAVMSTEADGASGFLVLDEKEKPRASLGTFPMGNDTELLISSNPSLVILDEKGNTVLSEPKIGATGRAPSKGKK